MDLPVGAVCLPACLSNQDAGPHSGSLQVRGPRFRERQLDAAGGNQRWGRVCGVLSLAGPADERGRLDTARVCGVNQLKFGPALTGSAPAALRGRKESFGANIRRYISPKASRTSSPVTASRTSPVGEYGPPTPASDQSQCGSTLNRFPFPTIRFPAGRRPSPVRRRPRASSGQHPLHR